MTTASRLSRRVIERYVASTLDDDTPLPWHSLTSVGVDQAVVLLTDAASAPENIRHHPRRVDRALAALAQRDRSCCSVIVVPIGKLSAK